MLIFLSYRLIPTRRLGENDKSLSQEEKYTNRLKMVRKKQNKRASKYSLEQQTDLTHFGKKVEEMSKAEIRQTYVGSGDERDEEPFSYDSLISKSKEMRAAARRQKMEAEAELEELDGSFKSLFSSLERRDMQKDKMLKESIDCDDDIAFLARSFQMDNIKKALAGERSITEAELKDKANQLIRKSEIEKAAAAEDQMADSDMDDRSVILESDNDAEPLVHNAPQKLLEECDSPNDFISLMRFLVKSPREIPAYTEKLVDLARSTNASEIIEFFTQEFFNPLISRVENSMCPNQLVIAKLATVLFPLDHVRHAIAVPVLKILETSCFSNAAYICHLILLAEFMRVGPKYSPAFFSLAGRLFRADVDCRETILSLSAELCAKFTRESLYGPIQYFFPELLQFIECKDEPFAPLRLHTFKPVEVLSIEPAFHQDGEEWNGQNKEIRESKKLDRKMKQEKRLTAKEMRREALATESFFAIEKQKEKAKVEHDRKRYIAKMQEAEESYKLTKTDNGKVDDRKMKSNKRRRQNK